MKNLAFILMLALGGVVQAKDVISADDLRPQVILQVQTFITDQSGKQIESISASQSRYSLQVKRGDISGVYMDNPKDFSPVRLDFTFKVNTDKSMSLTITQYASVQFDTATGKMIKEGKGKSETFRLSDFGSVSWVSESNPGGRVVTRFTPLISDEGASMKLTYTPMSLVNVVITDNAGKVWAEGSSAEGEVIAFQTYQGTLYVSFTEFKGAKEIGKAKGGVVELNLSEKLNVRIRSEKPILGEGISAKVFGAYVTSERSPSRTASSVGAMPASEAIKRISSGK